MADTDLIERLKEEFLRLSGRSIDRGCADSGIAANLADEAATALSERDKRIAGLEKLLAAVRDDAMRADHELCGMESRVEVVERERDASRAECGRLRAALQLTAGALQAGARTMAPQIAFTGEWAYLGKHRVSDILDKANAALSQKEAGDADR